MTTRTLCRCSHEDCGHIFAAFLSHPKETTVCPECGRQQSPQPVRLGDVSEAVQTAPAGKLAAIIASAFDALPAEWKKRGRQRYPEIAS